MAGDVDLREAFALLRSEEAQRAPTRAQLDAAAPRPTPGLRWLLLAAPIAAVALVALWLVPAGSDRDFSPPMAEAARATPGGWYTATDVLLEPHGSEILHTLPWEYEGEEPVEELRPTSRLKRRMST